MSIVIPSGKHGINWSPIAVDDSLVKTASTDNQEVEQIDDRANLYAAAEKALKEVAAKEKAKKEAGLFPGLGGLGEEAPCDAVPGEAGSEAPCDVVPEEGVVEVTEVTPMGEEGEVEPSGDVQKAVADLVEKAEAAEETAAKVEEAVAKVEEAVAEVKDAVGVCAEEVSEEGAEEASEEGDETAEIEIDVEDEGEEEGGEDIVVESEEPKADAFASKTTPEMEKSASAEEFIKLAKLTPKNRKKIADYWVRMLGYPRDYVNLLVKDYE